MSFVQADWRKDRRAQLKSAGVCSKCWQRPALIGRVQCAQCQMDSLIRENFKFDRKRNRNGATKARGTCYVDQFAQSVRRTWIDQIIAKWTGKCHYTGLEIEIGSTAGIDHMLPVSRACVFGPSKVYHPDNLVWCHKSINLLKGDRTADEFAYWLQNDLPVAMASVIS
jgi:5-methylcytosine-specific restriction endonuclease McrA